MKSPNTQEGRGCKCAVCGKQFSSDVTLGIHKQGKCGDTQEAGKRTQCAPGPWKAESDGNINAYAAPSVNVAQCRGGLSLAQNAANARLIASAPELLEAAKKFIEQATFETHDARNWLGFDELNTAISKAEGKIYEPVSTAVLHERRFGKTDCV